MFHDSCLSLNQVITLPYRPETDAAGELPALTRFAGQKKSANNELIL
ncbi:hypothetical protein [Xenorhabdus bovienii]|nr:hypothetical protein [Xenorhabdus bovienii]MDE9466275.1 hypothetical protein [Xenorhabdus bovienii]